MSIHRARGILDAVTRISVDIRAVDPESGKKIGKRTRRSFFSSHEGKVRCMLGSVTRGTFDKKIYHDDQISIKKTNYAAASTSLFRKTHIDFSWQGTHNVIASVV